MLPFGMRTEGGTTTTALAPDHVEPPLEIIRGVTAVYSIQRRSVPEVALCRAEYSRAYTMELRMQESRRISCDGLRRPFILIPAAADMKEELVAEIFLCFHTLL